MESAKIGAKLLTVARRLCCWQGCTVRAHQRRPFVKKTSPLVVLPRTDEGSPSFAGPEGGRHDVGRSGEWGSGCFAKGRSCASKGI